jgi:hypothetical protein
MSEGAGGFRIPLNPTTQPTDLISVARDGERTTLITLGADIIAPNGWPTVMTDITPGYMISWGASGGRGGALIDVDALPGVVLSVPCEALTITAHFRGYEDRMDPTGLRINFWGVIGYGCAAPWVATHTVYRNLPAGGAADAFRTVPSFMRRWSAYLTASAPVNLQFQPDNAAAPVVYLQRSVPITAPAGAAPLEGELSGAARYWRFDNSGGALAARAWIVFST